MELIYYRDPDLNFGDDLNELIWPHVLSGRTRASDQLSLVGIGSILTRERLAHLEGSGRIVAVLGSGTSYGEPPMIEPKWLVAAVRGPLTAAVIGLPEAAVTDGALLLADLPTQTPKERSPHDIVFMPHHRTIGLARWDRIAKAAGMRYVTPRQSVKAILEAFASAKLVVTEAMHGAIVADTLRIPWVPVIIAPTVDEFKWRDWTLSMQMPFEPASIPAGSASEYFRFRAMNAVLKSAGVSGHNNLFACPIDASHLTAFLRRRHAPLLIAKLAKAHEGRLPTRILSRSTRFANRWFERRATEALTRLVERRRSFLSDLAIFEAKRQAMREAVVLIEEMVARG